MLKTIPLSALLLAAPLLAGAPAMAQQSAPALDGPAAERFPQPVRVGDLIHREVLRPVEQQEVLGHVAGVVRRQDGAILFVLNVGGVLGFGTRPVAVPVAAMALLGQYVALLGLTPEQLGAQPTFDPAGTSPVAPDATIRVGLTRPFP